MSLDEFKIGAIDPLKLLSNMHGLNENLLREKFKKCNDIHASVGSSIFNTPIEQVTEDQRERVKNTTYLLLYGGLE